LCQYNNSRPDDGYGRVSIVEPYSLPGAGLLFGPVTGKLGFVFTEFSDAKRLMEEDILKKVARRQHHSVISPGVNFTNVLRAAFSQVDPKSVKNTVKPIVSFYTFGICGHKSCT
jgi:hypothetical protein